MKHQYREQQEVVIVKDLGGELPEVVGRQAVVKEQLPAKGKWPQYKVLLFGKGVGGLYEVDERELALQAVTK